MPPFLLLLLCLAGPADAATYLRASVGNIDVLTCDSPENTKRLVCELVEIRRQFQSLVGDLPLPDPRMQIVVFRTLRDYKDFIPAGAGGSSRPNYHTAGSFTADDYGLTISVVRDETYDKIRQVILLGYANYLLMSVAPDAPLWIQAGLPEFFSTTQCRLNKVFLGEPARNHAANVRGSKLLPLATLLSNAAMRPRVDTFNHDTVLYHESWALWHQWLTDESTDRRGQIRRLFAALRRGAAGDAATLGASFGQPVAEIEAAHRNRKAFGGWPVVVANANADSLVPGLDFKPADDLDRKSALAILFGRTRQGLGTLGYDLLRLAAAQPGSARAHEAMAVLAMGENDTEGSLRHWEQARELGTSHAFAYLVAARQSMEQRPFDLSLRGNLPAETVTRVRGLLQRCLALDPGQTEALYYRAWLEAFAPEPQRALVEELARSEVRYLRPGIFLTLAIAQWRLGDQAAAHRLLADYLALPSTTTETGNIARRLETTMTASEKPAA